MNLSLSYSTKNSVLEKYVQLLLVETIAIVIHEYYLCKKS